MKAFPREISVVPTETAARLGFDEPQARVAVVLRATVKSENAVLGPRRTECDGYLKAVLQSSPSGDRDKGPVVVARVPGLLGIPLDDQPLRIALAVVRIDIELAVVSAWLQATLAILKSASADIALRRTAVLPDILQHLHRLVWYL